MRPRCSWVHSVAPPPPISYQRQSIPLFRISRPLALACVIPTNSQAQQQLDLHYSILSVGPGRHPSRNRSRSPSNVPALRCSYM